MKVIVEKPTDEKLKQLDVSSWGIWECEPSTFEWHYDDRETCYLLEGKVTVKTKDQEIHLEKGDLGIFSKDLDCTWIVHEKVKKHYRFG
ncbi:cupin domain-containing protein [bacterium]|nr:cupin domain-containing protein [bacterium]MBU1064699.1 cupin domain-containing protein [bacterium]MBU1634094.1 cupin domain-containing protein [bacterium]MBU1872541.1 cupin domain-containing protein [bacterium]